MSDSFKPLLPALDSKEQKIVTAMISFGGDVPRTKLRTTVGGSNSTFVSKIENLKDKGIIEEYKNKQRKTTYRFSYHYAQILNFTNILEDKKWFHANQKIEIFPEFEEISKILMGKTDVYKTLGMEPHHISIETSLVTNESFATNQEKIRDILSLCNAYLQNIVTQKIHPTSKKRVEGYLIFRYSLEKPDAQLQRLFSQHISNYLVAKTSDEEYKPISKLGEITLKHPHLISILISAATQVSSQLKQSPELKNLRSNFTYFKDSKKPDHMMRMQILVSCLKIFKKYYRVNFKKNN